MKYYIYKHENSIVGVGIVNELLDGMIEITQEQFDTIDLSRNTYDYVNGEVIVTGKIELPTPTTLEDIKKDTLQLQEDNLTVMGAQAEQYENQESIKQDILSIMAAIAELYEMNAGGVK